MPNVEMVGCTDQIKIADKIICKTRDCEKRFNAWFEQHGNKRNASVMYTRHTTSDATIFAQLHSGIAKKSFEVDKLTAFHAAGGR